MKTQIKLSQLLALAVALASAASAQILPTTFPAVNIISPANHAVFHAPIDIPIFAYARPVQIFDPLLGTYRLAEPTNVEFYALNIGVTNDLGQGVNLGSATNVITPFFKTWSPQPRLAKEFLLVWSNALAGSNTLTAVARYHAPFFGPDFYRTSAPVNITVLLSPPDTNAPDVASIVATDPIAVAGTNAFAWPGITNGTPAWTNWPPPQWGFTTNWGPRNALFTVRRFGDASSDLILDYSIGGTASNGTDYAALPGSITIPAGAACALIPIVPIDTGSNGFPKTVILTLQPDTNAPPNYVVGLPPRAEALIVEDWLRPLPWLVSDGTFHVNTAGPDGAWFSIRYSTDFVNWSPLCTNQVFQGGIDFVDPDAPANSARFYQAVPLPDGPAN
jgi:hypothetical protein